MFAHKSCLIELGELTEKMIHGIRYYEIDGELLPSVTSILSIQSSERLEIWRKNMGTEVASYESRRSAERGKIFHQICEDYLNNKDVYKHKNKVLSFALFNMVKKHVDRIDNIYKIEQKLYSKNTKLLEEQIVYLSPPDTRKYNVKTINPSQQGLKLDYVRNAQNSRVFSWLVDG